MERGILIAFEGLDRAGKSTQCQMLVDALKRDGRSVRHIRFPDRTTPIGKMINVYLTGESAQNDHVIHLLFSANRWELADSIRKDIAAGTTVVLDRYYYSGCVYSAAKRNSRLDLKWARQPEVGLPRPDLRIFLSLDPEEAAKRGGYGAEKYENQQMQDRVRETFKYLIEHDSTEPFEVLDAGESSEKVHAHVRTLASDAIRRVQEAGMPLGSVEPW